MYLYRLTFPNGKCYIGVTVNVDKRFRRHKYLARTSRGLKNIPLYNAIRKYGWSNVHKEVLLTGEPSWVLQEEIFQISQHRLNNAYGVYNISCGGTAPMLGRAHSDSTKAKLCGRVGGTYWKGKSFSDEHRAKMSVARRKNPSPSKGIKWSDESRAKISKVSDAQAQSIREDHRIQSIIAREYGISQAQVSRIKNGVRRVKK